MTKDPVTTVALSRAEIYELLNACQWVDLENKDFVNARNKLRRCCPPPPETNKKGASNDG